MKIIISERQYKLLTENIPEIDSIIDKISSVGFNNLNDDEKELLKNYSEWLKTDKKTPFEPKKTKDFSSDLMSDVSPSINTSNVEFKKTLSDGSSIQLYSSVKPRQYKDFTEYMYDVEWDDQEWSGYISVDNYGDLKDIDFGMLSDDDDYLSLKEEMGPLYDEFEKWIEFEVIPEL